MAGAVKRAALDCKLEIWHQSRCFSFLYSLPWPTVSLSLADVRSQFGVGLQSNDHRRGSTSRTRLAISIRCLLQLRIRKPCLGYKLASRRFCIRHFNILSSRSSCDLPCLASLNHQSQEIVLTHILVPFQRVSNTCQFRHLSFAKWLQNGSKALNPADGNALWRLVPCLIGHCVALLQNMARI